MIPVTDRFLTALRDAHSIVSRCTLFPPDPADDPVPVAISGGFVDMNSAARVLRQGSVDVLYRREANAELVQLLHDMPYGGYCELQRGIQYADGEIELVQLGHFRVESVVLSELSGQATLTLADRYAQVQDEPFPLPWSPVGMHPSDAIVEIVRAVFGDSIAYHVLTDPASEGVMADVVYDQDRTTAISDLTSAIAADAIFDAFGDFVLRPNYSPDAEPVWSVDAGPGGVLISGQLQVDRSSVRNGVSVKGQANADQPPVYALATYANPASPVRWGGPFGRVVMLVESTAVENEFQALAVARSLLNLRLSLTRTFDVEAVPNPALEPEDVVSIMFADGHEEQQAIKEVHVGLGPDAALGIVSVDKYAADFSPETFGGFTGELAVEQLLGARLVAA